MLVTDDKKRSSTHEFEVDFCNQDLWDEKRVLSHHVKKKSVEVEVEWKKILIKAHHGT